MMTFSRRRIQNIIIFAVLAVLCFLAYEILHISLQPANFYTGWFLMALMIFLALYNSRKKLPFLPFLGKSALWLQLHVYIGFLTLVVFLLHVNFRFPNGTLEVLLMMFFLAVVGSGIIGIFISRKFPIRLTMRGEPIQFERIPIFRKEIKETVEKIVFDCVKDTKSSTITNFYIKKLLPFFAQPKNFFHHVFGSRRAYRAMLNDIEVTNRYCNSQEQEILADIKEWIDKKDDLDFQYALQLTLKGWLFFHIPITYSLLLVSLVHGILAYAYFGGLR